MHPRKVFPIIDRLTVAYSLIAVMIAALGLLIAYLRYTGRTQTMARAEKVARERRRKS